MEKLEWEPVLYNGIETNIEVTKFGRVRRIKNDWYGNHKNTKLGEVDFNKLKLKDGYMTVLIQIKGISRKKVSIHQLLASAFLGYKWNGHKFVVDHIDSNKTNNYLSNLRIITNRENNSKERTIKSGLPVGVRYKKNAKKYEAQIRINKKQVYLGLYNTPEEAAQAYQNKLKEISIQ